MIVLLLPMLALSAAFVLADSVALFLTYKTLVRVLDL